MHDKFIALDMMGLRRQEVTPLCLLYGVSHTYIKMFVPFNTKLSERGWRISSRIRSKYYELARLLLCCYVWVFLNEN